MKELLTIEFLKIKHHSGTRAFALLYLILLPLVYYGISALDVPFFATGSTLYRFPGVWRFLPYVASWFTVFPGILVVSLVCSEVTYKTQKQNVIDGLSRFQVILSKFYVLLAITIIATAYVFLLGVVFGAFSSHIADVFWGIEGIFFFFLQTAAVLLFALLTAVIIRNSALSILTFLVLFLFGGIILSQVVSEAIAQWLPFNMISSLLSNPWLADFNRLGQMANPGSSVNSFGLNVWLISACVFLYSVVFLWLSYVVMKKRDL